MPILGDGVGVEGLSSAVGGDAIADNEVLRGNGASGLQGSDLIVPDATDGHRIKLLIQEQADNGVAEILMTDGDDNEAEFTTSGLRALDALSIGASSAPGMLIETSGTGVVANFGDGTALGFTGGDALDAPDVDLSRVHDGTLAVSGWLRNFGNDLTGENEVVTDSTTLTDSALLVRTVLAGQAYRFRVEIPAETINTAGIKVAIGGAATFTNIIYDVFIHGISTPGFLTSGRGAAADAAVGVTASGTACHVTIVGSCVVNAGGAIRVKFAQNAETGAAETATILRGATFELVNCTENVAP